MTDRGEIVVVVGDVMNDVVVDPLGPVFPDSDTVSRIRRVAGGSGANQAAWLGYLGARCRFVGRVGRNDADRHRSEFVAACVEPMLAVDDEVDTGTVVSVVGAERRSMYSDRGANARLGPADLPDTALADAGLLHLSGYALFTEPSRAAVIEFRDRAVRRGCAVSVDPSSEALLRAAGTESFLAATAGADLCFPNVDEARALSDRADPVDAARALTAYYGTVIVTLGPAGCVVARHRRCPRWTRPARVTRSVRRTCGAGSTVPIHSCAPGTASRPVPGAQAGSAAGRRSIGSPGE